MSAVQNQHRVIWEPQPGPQTLLLRCHVQEIFYGGARGGGKTDGFLGHWLDHSFTYGRYAKGIFFRPTYKQLAAVIRRAKELYRPLGAEWNKSDQMFVFPNGSFLVFNHLQTEEDADNYQGHDYTWMAFEELTTWKSPEPIDKVRGALRSAHGVPCWYLANGNPGGPGHTWVKARYIDPSPALIPFTGDLTLGGKVIGKVQRVFIPALIDDNKYLRDDEKYRANLAAAGPEWLVRAWLEGDWDIVAGSYLEGVWDPSRHKIDPFDIPPGWKRWRAMDWGYARPYSIGWYAMDFDGVIYRYRELYGYGGAPNVGTREDARMVAIRIQQIEQKEREAGLAFQRNPADSEIWTRRGTERAIADFFLKSINHDLDANVAWMPADKSAGSRVNGAQEIVALLNQDKFKVFSTCKHWLRTVPALAPDSLNPEDVDTDGEDHAWDETRYSLISRRAKPTEKKDTRPPPGSLEHLLEG